MDTERKCRTKKRIKNFLIFYTLICILLIISYTLSRYVEVVQGTSGIDIAGFKVSVNGVDVRDGALIQFKFSDTSTFLNGKVAPNNSGYFEFTINPAGTEVSLEYEFMFEIDDIDADFKLTDCTINEMEDSCDITDGNLIKNYLLLPNNDRGFTEADAITVKVYWSWEEQEDIIDPDISVYENKNINVIATVKQKIE